MPAHVDREDAVAVLRDPPRERARIDSIGREAVDQDDRRRPLRRRLGKALKERIVRTRLIAQSGQIQCRRLATRKILLLMRWHAVLVVREARNDQKEYDRDNRDRGTIGSSHPAITPASPSRSQAQPAASTLITAEVRFGYALIADV